MDTSTNELSGGGETTKAETTATIASDQDTNNTSAEVTKMEIESVPESTTNITGLSHISTSYERQFTIMSHFRPQLS